MMRGIYALLERLQADTLVGVDKTLFRGAMVDVDMDQCADDIRHVLLGKGWPQNLAQAGFTATVAAQRYLIKLLAFLVHTQNADMANMVMAAGVHAAGNVQVQIANVEQVVQILKTLLDGFGHRNGLGVGQCAVVAAGAADNVAEQADVGGGEAQVADFQPQVKQLALFDIGQHDILFAGVACFAKTVALGQVGDGIQLAGADVAGRYAGLFQGQGDGHITGFFMGAGIACTPAGKARVLLFLSGEQRVFVGQLKVGGSGRAAADTGDFFFGQGDGAVFQVLPFFVYFFCKAFGSQCLDQNLDARLELVVAAAKAVVDPQGGFQIAEQVLPGHKVVDDAAQDGRAAQTAADQYLKAQLAGFVAAGMQADVVHFGDSAVGQAAVDGNLELAWQAQELRVKSGPLADNFAPGTRVHGFIGGYTGKGIGGGVANAVAAGLNGVHLYAGQILQDIGHSFQCRPVELDIGAGGNVGIILVILARNLRQHAQLA